VTLSYVQKVASLIESTLPKLEAGTETDQIKASYQSALDYVEYRKSEWRQVAGVNGCLSAVEGEGPV